LREINARGSKSQEETDRFRPYDSSRIGILLFFRNYHNVMASGRMAS